LNGEDFSTPPDAGTIFQGATAIFPEVHTVTGKGREGGRKKREGEAVLIF
jgi:hypothetical protein